MRAHAYECHNENMTARHALFDLVGVIARRRYQMAERRFAALGLNHTESRLLNLLHQQGGKASQEALSQMIFIDRSNVGRALKRLETDGFVTRIKDVADKRANFVVLTQKGQSAVAEIERLRQSMADDFFGSLTDAQAQAILDSLQNAMNLTTERGD